MVKTTKNISQTNVYEFVPENDVTIEDIVELAKLVRLGVSGTVLVNASESLRKHFVEIDSNK